MNPNQTLWEKGDFTRIAATMRESGETVVESLGITAAGIPAGKISTAKDSYTFKTLTPPAAYVTDFRTYYGPTMNAFAAAEQNGKSAELQRELERLFETVNV